MKAEIKQKWITALRSGEYKQGKRRLKDGDSYCCLGVLCDLYGKEFNVSFENTLERGEEFLGKINFLPTVVGIWSGIADISGVYEENIYHPNRRMLSIDNDNGKTFTEIADIIEKHF